MKRLLLVLATVGVMLAAVPAAFGDVFTFYLTVDKSPLSTPPPGSVLVTVTTPNVPSTTATVTFTGENGYYLDVVYFNVNGAFTVGTVTGTNSISPPTTLTYHANNGGGGGEGLDSYGTFSEDVTAAPNDPSNTIVIPLTAISGNSWANAFSVLTPTCASNGSQSATCTGGFGVPHPNGGGGYNAGLYGPRGFGAAAQIGTSATNGGADNQDLAGFVVPEPASLLLFGSVVLLLATFARRKSAAKV
jgi:PEP-CTERM motif